MLQDQLAFCGSDSQRGDTFAAGINFPLPTIIVFEGL